jgi:hypothetical protein
MLENMICLVIDRDIANKGKEFIDVTNLETLHVRVC